MRSDKTGKCYTREPDRKPICITRVRTAIFFYQGGNMSIYLIDYENVNESGLEGIKALKSEDQVHIFFSDQIKSIPFERSIELTQSRAHIEFIRTHKTAKNYLDFQLSTYLGYLIGKGEKGEVIVVSADKGFDSVVDFWKGRNIKISRFENIANKPSKQAAAKTKQTAKTSGKKQSKEEDSQELNTPKESPKAQKENSQTSKESSRVSKDNSKAQKEDTKPQKEKPKDLTESWRKKVRVAVKEDKLSPGKYSTVYKAIAGSSDKLELNNTLVKAFDSTTGGMIYKHVKDIFDEYSRQ